jgi:ribosomal protein L37AE/L43A
MDSKSRQKREQRSRGLQISEVDSSFLNEEKPKGDMFHIKELFEEGKFSWSASYLTKYCPNPDCQKLLFHRNTLIVLNDFGYPIEVCPKCRTWLRMPMDLRTEKPIATKLGKAHYCPSCGIGFTGSNTIYETETGRWICNICGYWEQGEKPKPYDPSKIRDEEIKERKTTIQDCRGPNPKSYIPVEVKPRTYRAQDTFEPRCFYVPEVKERKVRAQQPFGEKS